ncbi:hypothetical protein LSAT2_024933 [Lamellibrachia satsuma]|nr:hypothetical protein LSAT2_024933 [Lamellibrachia satsuma]
MDEDKDVPVQTRQDEQRGSGHEPSDVENRHEGIISRWAHTFGTTDHHRWFTAPEGGTSTWIIILISWWAVYVFALVFSSFKYMYKEIELVYGSGDSLELHVETAALGSLQVFAMMLLAPVGIYFEDILGAQKSCFIGAFVAVIGLVISYLVPNITGLLIAYGFITSLGMALSHMQCVAIMWHLFQKRLGRAIGFLLTASSTAVLTAPHIAGAVIGSHGLRNMFLMFAGSLTSIMLASWAWSPSHHFKPVETTNCCHRFFVVSFRPAIWRIPGFLMWVIGLQMCSLGLLTLYYHVGSVNAGTSASFFSMNTHVSARTRGTAWQPNIVSCLGSYTWHSMTTQPSLMSQLVHVAQHGNPT